MMKSLFVGAIGCFLLSVNAGAAYFQSTTTWIARCERPIEVSERQTAEFVLTSQPLSDCYAYLMAVFDGLDASSFEFMKSVRTSRIRQWENAVCFPEDLDQEKLRQSFLSYAKRYPYPKLTGTSPAYVAADAFALSWPCEGN